MTNSQKLLTHALIMVVFLGGVAAQAEELSHDPETANVQKAKLIASEHYQHGVAPNWDPLLFAILEVRMKRLDGSISRDAWLVKERELNASLQTALLEAYQAKRITGNKFFDIQSQVLGGRAALLVLPGKSK